MSEGDRVNHHFKSIVVVGMFSAFLSACAGTWFEPMGFSGPLDYQTISEIAQPQATILISYSPGGSGAAARALGRAKKVIVDGPCLSACTWGFIVNANTCFTDRAEFGFHGAHDPVFGTPMPVATKVWLAQVRPALRQRVANILISSEIIYMSAKEMQRYYGDRKC